MLMAADKVAPVRELPRLMMIPFGGFIRMECDANGISVISEKHITRSRSGAAAAIAAVDLVEISAGFHTAGSCDARSLAPRCSSLGESSCGRRAPVTTRILPSRSARLAQTRKGCFIAWDCLLLLPLPSTVSDVFPLSSVLLPQNVDRCLQQGDEAHTDRR